MMLPVTQTTCLKYGHTNFCFYVGTSMRYFWQQTMFLCKNDTASDTYFNMFEGYSYKFPSQLRNWYKILWRLLGFVCQKMMLPATGNSCLKYIHTNISMYVGTGKWYIDQLNDLYPKTSTGNKRQIAASNSFVAQTRGCKPSGVSSVKDTPMAVWTNTKLAFVRTEVCNNWAFPIVSLARHQKNWSCMFIPNPTYGRFDSNSCKTPMASHKVTTSTESHLPTHNTVAKAAQFWVRFIQNGTQNRTSKAIFAKCSARIAPGYRAAKMARFWEWFVKNGTQNRASKKPLLFMVFFWPHHA